MDAEKESFLEEILRDTRFISSHTPREWRHATMRTTEKWFRFVDMCLPDEVMGARDRLLAAIIDPKATESD